MRTIGIILKKELKRYFTDVRMLVGIILPGFLIFLLYSVMGNFMGNQSSANITEFTMYVEKEPEELKPLFEFKDFDITINPEALTKDEILEKVKNQEVDLYILYPENFYQDMLAYTSASSQKAPNIDIYYNSASEASTKIFGLYSGALNLFESTLSNKFDINNSDATYDLAKEEDITVRIFTMMLPFLLITFLFSGAMGICSDSIAGEKERGTIATLLVTPAKRRDRKSVV